MSGALELLTETDILEGENAYYYDGGGSDGSNSAGADTSGDPAQCAAGAGGAGVVRSGLQRRAYRQCRIVGQGSSGLPPVLFANISRFTIDRTKDNTKLAIEQTLDLSPFLVGAAGDAAAAAEGCSTYELSAVLVHSGTNAFGHYWSYVKCRCHDQPAQTQAVAVGAQQAQPGDGLEGGDGSQLPPPPLSWLAFNDAIVSSVTEAEVLATASGGDSTTSSAYMLVYVRSDRLLDASAHPGTAAAASAE